MTEADRGAPARRHEKEVKILDTPDSLAADRALRGRLLWFLDRPEEQGEAAVRYIEDGLLVLQGGKIVAVGEAADLTPRLPAGLTILDHSGKLIVPGFIDPHIHLPQTQVVASYAGNLLEWLNTYTFVEEKKYADAAHAARGAA